MELYVWRFNDYSGILPYLVQAVQKKETAQHAAGGADKQHSVEMNRG